MSFASSAKPPIAVALEFFFHSSGYFTRPDLILCSFTRIGTTRDFTEVMPADDPKEATFRDFSSGHQQLPQMFAADVH